jgi:hypothetical protein
MVMDGTEQNTERNGVIAGSARVVRELIRTPRLLKTARILLANLDPENAPVLIRTLVYQDATLTLDLLSATPDLVKTALLAGREICTLLLELPRELRNRFLLRLLAELPAEQAGEVVGLALIAGLRLVEAPPLTTALSKVEEEFHQGLKQTLHQDNGAPSTVGPQWGKVALAVSNRIASRLGEMAAEEGSSLPETVQLLAQGIRQLARDNPLFMKKIVQPLCTAWQEALQESKRLDEGSLS